MRPNSECIMRRLYVFLTHPLPAPSIGTKLEEYTRDNSLIFAVFDETYLVFGIFLVFDISFLFVCHGLFGWRSPEAINHATTARNFTLIRLRSTARSWAAGASFGFSLGFNWAYGFWEDGLDLSFVDEAVIVCVCDGVVLGL